MWSDIIQAVPGSVLWLLRFPPAAEAYLIKAALDSGMNYVVHEVRVVLMFARLPGAIACLILCGHET